jgi:hypothetical protein
MVLRLLSGIRKAIANIRKLLSGILKAIALFAAIAFRNP